MLSLWSDVEKPALILQVVLFDVQQRSTIAELGTPFIKYVMWSADMNAVALLSKHAVIIANKKLGNSCTGEGPCQSWSSVWCALTACQTWYASPGQCLHRWGTELCCWSHHEYDIRFCSGSLPGPVEAPVHLCCGPAYTTRTMTAHSFAASADPLLHSSFWPSCSPSPGHLPQLSSRCRAQLAQHHPNLGRLRFVSQPATSCAAFLTFTTTSLPLQSTRPSASSRQPGTTMVCWSTPP